MSHRASGEGSIGRRKDGSYYGAIRLDGKRRWVYGETRKEVASKLKALHRQFDQGISLDADKVTVEAFLARWLEQVKLKNKPRTYESYRQVVKAHIIPCVGTVMLSALRPDHVQALVSQVSKGDKAPRTVDYARSVLSRALNQAIKWRLILFNPAAVVDSPRAAPRKVEPLTREEAQQFLAALKGHRLEALYLLALLLGLRRGEVLGLQLTDLDFDAGTVAVTGGLQREGGKLVRGTTKTAASARTLPIPPSVIPLLRVHIERQQAEFPKNKYLFASVAGTPLEPRNVVRQFKALLKRAGLRSIRFHDLRHSAATFLIARGEHPRTVMEILGHTHISTTLQIYGHVLQETKVAAIASMDSFLIGG